MTYFDRQLKARMTERAADMSDEQIAAFLADPEVSPAGRRVLEAEVATRQARRVAS